MRGANGVMGAIQQYLNFLAQRPGGEAQDFLAGMGSWSFRFALLVAAGLLVCSLLRRRTAALRSRILLVAVLAAMLLPIAGRLLPALHVLPLITPKERTAIGESSPIGAAPVVPSEPSSKAQRDVSQAGSGDRASAQSSIASIDTTQVLVGVWLLGFGIFVGRYLLGRWALGRIRHLATQPAGANLRRLFEEARSKLGVRRHVDLLVTDQRSMPMTWGPLRPVVLLPAASSDWSREKALAVLSHELAHVRRRDALTQMMITVVCALHWFNPVAWLAQRKLVALREEACDELVLDAAGVKASVYATALVDLASGASEHRLGVAGGLAMANSSRLGARTEAILRVVRPSEQAWVRVSIIWLSAIVAVVLCVVGGVLAAQPEWGKDVTVTLSLKPGKNRVTFPDGKFDPEDHLDHSHYLQWRDSWAPGIALKELPRGGVSLVVQNAGAAPASGSWDTAARLLPPIDGDGKGVLGNRDVDRFAEIPLTTSFDSGLDATQTWLLERYGRMQVRSFDMEKGTVEVRFQFRKPLAALNSPTRGPADDEPIPSICVYVPDDLLPCLTECGQAFGHSHPDLGVVRVDSPKHPMLGLGSEKGIGITDWRPEKAQHKWVEALEESTLCYKITPTTEEGVPGGTTTYHLYHWPDTSDDESAFLDWLAGEEASRIITSHGFVLEPN